MIKTTHKMNQVTKIWKNYQKFEETQTYQQNTDENQERKI